MINLKNILLFSIAVSAVSLGFALIAEHVFNLAPCILCKYQRIPFIVIIFISSAPLLKSLLCKNASSCKINCAFWASITVVMLFLTNAALAFYHVGVEQKWWKSFLEGCAVPNGFLSGDITPEQMLAQINAAKVVSCSDPAWLDPIFGMSMAFWNMVLCLGMAGLITTALILLKRRAP